MILLDILKVKKKNHPGNQNAVGKEYIRNTGLVFRLGGAIVSFFFFKLWQKQQNFPKEQSSSQLRFLWLYLLDNLKIKQNATKYILNLIWFAKASLLFTRLKEFSSEANLPSSLKSNFLPSHWGGGYLLSIH